MKTTSLRAEESRSNRGWETLIATKLKIRSRATFAGPLRGVQTSLGILPGKEVRIASKPEKLVGVKTPKRELTFARLSSIEIKLKRFLKVRRDRAPAKPDSWSSGGRF